MFYFSFFFKISLNKSKIIPPDSKNVKKETQENSLKSVLDQSLTKTKNSSDSSTKPSSNLEQEILKQIK